jgi:uncharacterized protein involved in tellurium resistance
MLRKKFLFLFIPFLYSISSQLSLALTDEELDIIFESLVYKPEKSYEKDDKVMISVADGEIYTALKSVPVGNAPSSVSEYWANSSTTTTDLANSSEFQAGMAQFVSEGLEGRAAELEANASKVIAGLSPVITTRLVNISTRGYVGTGDSSMIVSFIVEGNGSKTVTIRALGPILGSVFNVANSLSDPFLSVTNQATGAEIVSNDNWQTASSASAVTSSGKSEGIDSKESAVQITLDPGQYSAVVTGVNGATGNALVEVYDEDNSSGSIALANVSTRGYVGTGDSNMIVSFIVEGTGSKTVTVRALGPILGSVFNVANSLSDPFLSVTNQATGAEIVSNDNWQTASSASAVTSSGKSEGIDSKESAVQLTLEAGQYSAVVTGVSGATGNALVEVYDED